MKQNSQAFVNQIVVCLLVTICLGGSVGLGTVYMRHQISSTANVNRQLTTEIAELRRLMQQLFRRFGALAADPFGQSACREA